MKQREKTQLTRERILAAAMNEFGVRGHAGASLNNICAAGIPKGLLYHNFESKDALYLACVEICFNDLTEHMKKAEVGSDLQKYLSARFCFFKEHPKEAHIFFDALLQPPEALREQIQTLRAGFDELNSALYQRLLSTVTLRQGVLYEDALQYFSMLQMMFNTYFSSPAFSELPFEEKIDLHEARLSQMLDFMLYGIAERDK